MTKFRVNIGAINCIDPPVLISGSSMVFPCSFSFGAEWAGLKKTVVYRAGKVTVERLLLSDMTDYIPWEVLVTPGLALEVGVYGVDGNGVIRPTVWCKVGKIYPGAIAGSPTAPPTPSAYDQILTQMGNLSTLSTTDKSSLVNAINEVSRSSGGSGTSNVPSFDLTAMGLPTMIPLADAVQSPSGLDLTEMIAAMEKGPIEVSFALRTGATKVETFTAIGNPIYRPAENVWQLILFGQVVTGTARVRINIYAATGQISGLVEDADAGGAERMVVTFTGDEENGYTADYTFAEIDAAVTAGKNVVALTPYGGLMYMVVGDTGRYYSFSSVYDGCYFGAGIQDSGYVNFMAYELAGSDYVLPKPETASVGQVIKVKSVDENGNVTGVEAVDQDGGSGSWADLGVAYTKGELLFEATLELQEAQTDESGNVGFQKHTYCDIEYNPDEWGGFVPGQLYIVSFDGVEHPRSCYNYGCIGNGSIWGYPVDTGESWVVDNYDTGRFDVTNFDLATDFKLYAATITKKIDPAFLHPTRTPILDLGAVFGESLNVEDALAYDNWIRENADTEDIFNRAVTSAIRIEIPVLYGENEVTYSFLANFIFIRKFQEQIEHLVE